MSVNPRAAKIVLALMAAAVAGCGDKAGRNEAGKASAPQEGSVAASDAHERWRAVEPVPAATVRERAAGTKFDQTSQTPPEASDVLDYYDASPAPEMSGEGPIILGKITIKKDGTRLKDRGADIKQGEYYHWLAFKDGAWVSGFTSTEGETSLTGPALFTVSADPHHAHIKVWSHSPEDARALGRAALAQAGPIRHPPPTPRPPARCIAIWSRERVPNTNPPQYICVQTGWVVN
jgi:hypothetical protein